MYLNAPLSKSKNITLLVKKKIENKSIATSVNFCIIVFPANFTSMPAKWTLYSWEGGEQEVEGREKKAEGRENVAEGEGRGNTE